MTKVEEVENIVNRKMEREELEKQVNEKELELKSIELHKERLEEEMADVDQNEEKAVYEEYQKKLNETLKNKENAVKEKEEKETKLKELDIMNDDVRKNLVQKKKEIEKELAKKELDMGIQTLKLQDFQYEYELDENGNEDRNKVKNGEEYRKLHEEYEKMIEEKSDLMKAQELCEQYIKESDKQWEEAVKGINGAIKKEPVAPTPATPTPVTVTPITPTPATVTPATPTPATVTPATVTPATPTPATVTPATVTPATVTPATPTPATVTPATVTPATVTPATVTPATVTPATVTPATVTLATVTPATPTPATVTPATPTPIKITIGRTGRIHYNGEVYNVSRKVIKKGVDIRDLSDVEFAQYMQEKMGLSAHGAKKVKEYCERGLFDTVVVNAILSTKLEGKDKENIFKQYLNTVRAAEESKHLDDKVKITYDMEDLSKVSFIDRLRGKTEIGEMDKVRIVEAARTAERWGLAKTKGEYKYSWKAKLFNFIKGTKLPKLPATMEDMQMAATRYNEIRYEKDEKGKVKKTEEKDFKEDLKYELNSENRKSITYKDGLTKSQQAELKSLAKAEKDAEGR